MRACACYLYEHASLNDSQRGGRGHCMDKHTSCIKYLVSTSCHAHMSACKTEGTPWYYGGFCASTFLFARGTIFNRTAKPLLFRFSSIKYQHGWITSRFGQVLSSSSSREQQSIVENGNIVSLRPLSCHPQLACYYGTNRQTGRTDGNDTQDGCTGYTTNNREER